MKQFKKCTQFGSYIALPIILVTLGIVAPNADTFEEAGSISLILIGLILFLKPIATLTKAKPLMQALAFRRELGVASFWFFLFHSAGMIWIYKLYDPALYLDVTSYLFWGAVAGIGMILLGLTSNNVAVRFLKRNWKRLQYIAYPTFFAALIHAQLAEGEGILIPTAVIITFIALKYRARATA